MPPFLFHKTKSYKIKQALKKNQCLIIWMCLYRKIAQGMKEKVFGAYQ